jgi:hypothetical protein
MSRFPLLVVVAFLQFFAPPAVAQSAIGTAVSPDLENAVLRIKSQFDAQYVVAKMNSEGTDLVAPGTVLVVRKENLIMNKVLLDNGKRGSPIENVYENGRIDQSGLLGAMGKLSSFLGGSRPENHARTIELGTKLWVTNVSVATTGIEFRLMSDPINDQRFHGVLRFPIADAAQVDQVVSVIPEVLAFDQPPARVARVASAPAADAKDPEAMYQMANALAQSGENVDAVRWFEKASSKGHAKASNALGFMYEEGRGVPQNFARANALYLKAMKGGDAVAMTNRGVMILNGKGANKDPQQAYMHFLLAAAYARDDAARDEANKLKDEVAATLTSQQIARGQTMADRFAKQEIK